jgi:hypothetical protein
MRNRIKAHRKVRAADLVPHELNPRTHTDAQRQALTRLYDEIGFARSLLAYELPDGRLKLIDGHLRQSLTPDEEVEVEVLDVTDAEARALLLAIDPLAQLAGYDQETLAQLREQAEKDSQAVKSLWQTLEEEAQAARRKLKNEAARQTDEGEERFLVLVECASEKEQIDLLRKFRKEGLTCEAKIA